MRALLALAVCVAVPAAGRTAQAGALASPMIDASIFRDGQVLHNQSRIGAWTTLCDEIPALKRRFCSLRSSVARDARGRPVYLDVSTGDDGRPAVLIHLPLGIALRPGIVVGATAAPARAVAAVAACSATECQAVWNIDAQTIKALNARSDLSVSFCTLRPGFSAFRPSLGGGCETRSEMMISGQGFGEAVAASLR